MPTATNLNIPLIHRKEWQMMTPAPITTAAGAFVITDVKELDNLALFMSSATVHYLYHHDEDAFVQIPSGALAGTFGAGSCGCRSRWSGTLTANGGSTTTATTTALISGIAIGKTVRFLTGLNAGKEAVITGALIVPAGTSTIQFAALGSAVANTDTFIIDTGRFYVVNAGTLAAGSFKSYDPLLGTWATLVNTNLPATIGTDGRLVATPSNDVFVTGTATAGAASTITNGAKTWTVNQWTNYQIRITAGTGIGQIRTIASNTGTVITTSAAWTTNPDATSVYEITGNDDFLYFIGNNAITMYRYSISANTWTVMAPTTARGSAPSTGMSANWVGITGDANWANESNIQDGRYIFSFRGGAGALVDRFDIAGGTAGAGVWAAITYINQVETFTTGSSYAVNGRYIFIRKDATHRYFKFSVRGNYLEPLSTNLYPDGAALLGDKLWIKNYAESGTVKLSWLYSLRNTGTELHRMLLY
jgi:hypothetical protein